MGIWQKTRSLTRNFFRRDNVERDLDAEVRSYSYLLEEEKMSNGMNSSDARRSAHMNMGSTEQGLNRFGKTSVSVRASSAKIPVSL
jgi:hypothetical protein